jgi:hypothetical protein
VVVAFALWGIALHGSEKEVQKTDSSPFVVSLVPTWSGVSGRGISMAANTLDTFYVLLTNVSPQVQAAFRTSNSWGYSAISFELRTGNGRIVAITKRPEDFTKNNPSTFVIPPGEQMVYPIKLDGAWVAGAPLPKADEEPVDVTLKAIYEVKPTPESTGQKVWTGRVESAEYHLKFRHWSEHLPAASKR